MGVLQRVVGAVLGLVLLVAALVFTSLILGALLAAGIVVYAWLWWRSRDRLSRGSGRGGAVIEGEYRDVTQKE